MQNKEIGKVIMEQQFEVHISQRVSDLRASLGYTSYLRTRRAVYAMMDAWGRVDSVTSSYWKDELAGFVYLFDASPLLIEKIREQSYHITGIRSYEYRPHHTHQAEAFEQKYQMLRAVDRSNLFISEPPTLGGFGFDLSVGLANIDTLKFYEVLIGMDRANLLSQFRADEDNNKVVCEIGSGWGGFAYQFKKLFPNATYICVDLPPTVLFSGTYLLTAFPEAKCIFYGEPGFEDAIATPKEYDFVFVPHFYFEDLVKSQIKLAINMVSFQEMTSSQVDGYARRLRQSGCSQLYSMNRDRSPHNTELSSVGEILRSHYKVDTVPVLNLQYTQLKPPNKPKRELSVLDYRHYFAHA